jgi:hypothetical protein
MSQNRDRKGEISRTKTEADSLAFPWSEGEMRFNSTLAAALLPGLQKQMQKSLLVEQAFRIWSVIEITRHCVARPAGRC